MARLSLDALNDRLTAKPPVAAEPAPPARDPGGVPPLSLDQINQRLQAPAASSGPVYSVPSTGLGAVFEPLADLGDRGRRDAPDTPSVPRGSRIPAVITPARTLREYIPTGAEMGAAGKAIVQGAAEIPASQLRSLGVEQTQAGIRLQRTFDKIDAGEILTDRDLGDFGPQRQAMVDYLNASPPQRKSIRVEHTVTQVPDQMLYRAGETISSAARDVAPVPAQYERGMPVQIARGLGSAGAFMAEAVAGRVLGAPTAGVVAGAGALSAASEQYRDAISHGATFEDALKAGRFGMLFGTSEALPITQALDRFDKATGGTVKRAFVEGLKGATEESLQEMFQKLANDLVASDVVKYDEDRNTFEGMGETAGVSLTVGGLMSFTASLLGARLRGPGVPASTPQDAAAAVRDAALQMSPDMSQMELDGAPATGLDMTEIEDALTAEVDATIARAEAVSQGVAENRSSLAEITARIAAFERADVTDPNWAVDLAAVPSPVAEPTPVPAAVEIDDAAAETETPKSPEQAEAGNYKKGHISWNGLDIAIETPRDGERSGTGADGKPWSVIMPAHYGYVNRTEGADGDHVDVYIGSQPEAGTVYIVDQIDPDSGKFDEHKVIIGAATKEEATRLYHGGFSDGSGPARMGDMTPVTVGEFKDWLKEGDTSKPAIEATPTADLDAEIERAATRWEAHGRPKSAQRLRDRIGQGVLTIDDVKTLHAQLDAIDADPSKLGQVAKPPKPADAPPTMPVSKQPGEPTGDKTPEPGTPSTGRKTPAPDAAPGDKVAARLRKAADALDKKIYDLRNSGTSNQTVTRRRTAILEGQATQADSYERSQRILRSLADLQEQGEVPAVLEGFTSRPQIEMIAREHSRYADRPQVSPRDLRELFKQSQGIKGTAAYRRILKSQHDRGGYDFHPIMPKQMEALSSLASAVRKVKGSAHIPSGIGYGIDSYKKQRAAGINTAGQFDEAKRLLMALGSVEVSAEEQNRRRIAKIERDLVGTKIPGYFPTPTPLARELVNAAAIEPGMRVLEPGAGKGSIADVVRETHPDASLDVLEVSATLSDLLRRKGYDLAGSDFLEHQGEYDRIVMNPPFEKGQDIDHVRKAYDMLAPGGRVVSIMGRGAFFRSDKKATGFREWLEERGGVAEELPEQSFMSSDRPTGVATSLVIVDKPGDVTTSAPSLTGETIELSNGVMVPVIRDNDETFIASGEQIVRVTKDQDGDFYNVGQDYASSPDDVRELERRRQLPKDPVDAILARPYETLEAMSDTDVRSLAKVAGIRVTKNHSKESLIEKITEVPAQERRQAYREYLEQRSPPQQPPPQQPPQQPQPGDGLAAPGEILVSASGRRMRPVPDGKQKGNHRKEISATARHNRMNKWLLDEATAEAKTRSDDGHISGLVEGLRGAKDLSQADRDLLNDIIFGQPTGPNASNRLAVEDQVATADDARPGAGPNPDAGRDMVAYGPQGTKITYVPMVVSLRRLIASNTADFAVNPFYPQELQPRDRSRAAARQQITNIAANLKPELLDVGGSITDGAPIVGDDFVVESGNGRVMAIRQAYADGMKTGDDYRGWLLKSSWQSNEGSDRGITDPVLVRVRSTPMTPEQRQSFVREANQRTTLQMSESEQAKSDAESMPEYLLDEYAGGSLATAKNAILVQGFAKTVLGASEQGQIFDAQGHLSQAGGRRIENAMFMQAYGDAALLANLREDTDTNIKGLGNALVESSGRWALMRRAARNGDIPADMDITPNLIEAVRLVQRSRQLGQPVGDLMAQTGMFDDGPSAQTRAILERLYNDEAMRRPRSWAKISEMLQRYSTEARKVSATTGLDLGLDPVTPASILESGDDGAGQGDLLGGEGTVAASMQRMEPGSVYQPLIKSMGGTPGGPRTAIGQQPMRREDIINDLMQALGVPLYQGKVRGKSMLGFYRPGREEVRVKYKAHLEVVAHEIAHLLDDRISEIRQQWNPATKANKAVRDELRGVSYDKKKIHEGFAEFVRLWMTQPRHAQDKVPLFSAWFDDFVTRSPYGPALLQAREKMTDWYAQNAVDRGRSKIGQPTADINDWMPQQGSALRQSVFDDLEGIAAAERSLYGDVKPGGMYETARLMRGQMGVVEGAMRYGAPNKIGDQRVSFVDKDGQPSVLLDPEKGPIANPDYKPWGLMEILRPISEQGALEEFGLYAVGRRAEVLAREGRENLLDRHEIDSFLKLETPAFRKAFEDWNAYNKQVLDFAQSAGLIDAEARKRWQTDVYIPFYRVENAKSATTQAGGTPGHMKVVHKLHGGSSNLENPITNMFNNTAMLVKAALLSEARAKVINDIMAKQGSAKLVSAIATTTTPVRVAKEQVEAQFWKSLGLSPTMVRHGMVPEELIGAVDAFKNMPDWMQVFQTGQAPKGEQVIAVMRGGKPVYYEVADPLLFRALGAMPRRPDRIDGSGKMVKSVNMLMDALRVFKRVGQSSVTISVDFAIRNLMRDQATAWVFSRYGYTPYVDAARGLKSRIMQDPTYQEYLANGGALAGFFSDDEVLHRRLSAWHGSKGINVDSVINTPVILHDFAMRALEAFEVGTRLGAFQKALEAGRSSRESAYEAREISVDFAMRGDNRTLGLLYDTVMFLKAGVVGMDRTYRGFRSDPQKWKAAAKTAAVVMAGVGLYVLNRGNPLFEELEDWERDIYWHIFIPNADAMKHLVEHGSLPDVPAHELYSHFRMPKPFEVGAMSTIGERAMQGVLDKDPSQALKATKAAAEMFRLEYIPQAAIPLIEQWANKERFRGRPIETDGQQSLAPWARLAPSTSRTMQAYGEDVIRKLPASIRDNLPDTIASPVRMEALLKGYLNSWAALGLMASDAMFFDDAPDLPVENYPGLRVFYRSPRKRYPREVTEFYDLLREATETRRTASRMVRVNRPEIADNLLMSGQAQNYEILTNANQMMRGVKQEIDLVRGMRTAEELRDYAGTVARVPAMKSFVDEARKKPSDVGYMKGALLEGLVLERSQIAKDVVADIEAAERED